MKADDELCLCFHVTRRKVEQYLRARRPAVASQLSECYGAGTGCGWCRPFLQRLHAQAMGDAQANATPVKTSPAGPASAGGPGQSDAGAVSDDLPDAANYAADRAAYRQKQRTGSGDA